MVVEVVLPVLSSLAGEVLTLLLRVLFTDDVTGVEFSPSLATDLSEVVSPSSLLLPLVERVRVREVRVEEDSLSESLLSLVSAAASLLSEPFEEDEDDDEDVLVARGVDDDDDVTALSLLAEDEPESESEPDALDVRDSLLLLLLLLSVASGVSWVG